MRSRGVHVSSFKSRVSKSSHTLVSGKFRTRMREVSRAPSKYRKKVYLAFGTNRAGVFGAVLTRGGLRGHTQALPGPEWQASGPGATRAACRQAFRGRGGPRAQFGAVLAGRAAHTRSERGSAPRRPWQSCGSYSGRAVSAPARPPQPQSGTHGGCALGPAATRTRSRTSGWPSVQELEHRCVEFRRVPVSRHAQNRHARSAMQVIRAMKKFLPDPE